MKRTERFYILLTPAEREILDAMATRRGISPSALMRMLMLDAAREQTIELPRHKVKKAEYV